MKLATSAIDATPAAETTGRGKRGPSASLKAFANQSVLCLALMMVAMTSVGCFLPIYSARPERRVQQLLYTSENLRALVDEWERFWQLDAPSHLTPIRTHGGVL